MPYKNIVFAKLEKRLLNDHRWFTMSEQSQLIYIKLILVAQETYNEIPKNVKTLSELCRCKRKGVLERCLIEIKNKFPKFKETANYYYFDDFHEKTNYIRAEHGHSQVLPKAGVDKDKDKEEDKEEEKEKETTMAGERKLVIKDYFLDLLPVTLTQQEIEAWVEWVDYRKETKKKLTISSAKKQIEFLLNQPNMVNCISQSIKNQWQGLFEDKENGTTKINKANSGFQSQLADPSRGNVGRKFNYITSRPGDAESGSKKPS